jgi:hypothetical protein
VDGYQPWVRLVPARGSGAFSLRLFAFFLNYNISPSECDITKETQNKFSKEELQLSQSEGPSVVQEFYVFLKILSIFLESKAETRQHLTLISNRRGPL